MDTATPLRLTKWYYMRNEFLVVLGVAFVLYGLLICLLSYFPLEEQRGSLISSLLPRVNIFATLVGFYITLSTTYMPPNSRRGTNAARLVFAPALMLAPAVIVVIGYESGAWPSADILLGATFVAIGVSILRTFVRTANFDDESKHG